jgi:predicted nucleotidyltransferase component of viral defense system
MHNAIYDMISKYNCRTVTDYSNALKEIIQEIALLGLYRANFFDKAVFYGGTALRMVYGLDRFSEDIDFSLIQKDEHFDIMPYCKFVQDELSAFGFEVEVTSKQKRIQTNIESAFIKTGTHIHLVKVGVKKEFVDVVPSNELLKVKLEVDTTPPGEFDTEIKYQLNPIPYHVRMMKLPFLFAGKVHALTCRQRKGTRIKGRDLYDYVWFITKDVPLHIQHLEDRMKQTNHISKEMRLTSADIYKLLLDKFALIDYKQAKEDVMPFIKNSDKIQLWSESFFSLITEEKLQFVP